MTDLVEQVSRAVYLDVYWSYVRYLRDKHCEKEAYRLSAWLEDDLWE